MKAKKAREDIGKLGHIALAITLIAASFAVMLPMQSQQANAAGGASEVSLTSNATRDGWVEENDNTWIFARNTSTGSDVYADLLEDAESMQASEAGGKYYITRSFVSFNTSISDSDDVVIVSCELAVKQGSDCNDSDVALQFADIGDGLGTEDYDSFSGSLLDWVSWSDGWHTFEIDRQLFQSNFNGSGWTDFCLREYSHDYINSKPPTSTYIRNGMYYGDSSGNEPMLNFSYIYLYPPSDVEQTDSSSSSVTLSFSRDDNASHTYIRYSTSGYPSSRSDGSFGANVTGGQAQITGLADKTKYYFTLWSYNETHNVYSRQNATITAYSGYPNPPSDVQVARETTGKVNISWTNAADNFNSTMIRMSTEQYPDSHTDGSLVYNGTDEYTVYSVDYETSYYFTGFTYGGTGWSQTGNDADTWGVLEYNVDESEENNTDATFNLYMSSGTTTLDDDGVTSPASYSYGEYPMGEDIYTRIEDTSGVGRTLYLDIQQTNTYYHYDTFLVKNGSRAYYASVQDGQGEAVNDAEVSIYYNGDLIEQLITTANGVTDWFYLNTSYVYKFEISKAGLPSETQHLSPPTSQQEISFSLPASTHYIYVTDQAGNPVPDATVYVNWSGNNIHTLTTGANGATNYIDLYTTRSYTITTTKQNYPSETITKTPQPEQQQITVMLPTTPHYVSVVDEVGNPVKDAQVEIYHDGVLLRNLTTTSMGITDWFYLNGSQVYHFEVSRTGYYTETDNLSLPMNQQEIGFRLMLKGGGDYESIYDDIMYSITPREGSYTSDVTVNYSIVSTNSTLEYWGMKIYKKHGGYTDAEWLTPTAHSDVSGSWSNESHAYDGNTSTAASMTLAADATSGYLELTRTETRADRIRWYLGRSGEANISVDSIDIQYDSGWHTLATDPVIDWQSWEAFNLDDSRNITGLRLRFNNTGSTAVDIAIYEADIRRPPSRNETWTLVKEMHNATGAGGGNVSYTLNETGQWRVDPYFKKENLSEYEVGSAFYVIENKTGLHDIDWDFIPGNLFFMVLTVLAGLAAAFFYPYVGSGCIWMAFGVYAVGFIVNEGFTVDIGVPLSGWNLLIIMGLLFFSLWMVVNRI